MIQYLLFLWLAIAVLILFAHKMARILIYFGVFSLVTSLCFLFLGAPDVAMAEAAISVFTTIFFIVCYEKYYNLGIDQAAEVSENAKRPSVLKTHIIPLCFVVSLLAAFIFFLPENYVNTYLKDQYIAMFASDVGGENAVTAIYLGYRVYDTLFEALMLVIAVVAVAHMSYYGAASVKDGKGSEIGNSGLAIFTIRVICPMMLLFGVYLIINGQYTPGGGFQGGLAVATFFICRYLIYEIYDVQIERVLRIEEMIFASTILLAIFVVFLGAAAYMPAAYLPLFQDVYLITMNVLIGMKVACAFFILFYRYITIERR